MDGQDAFARGGDRLTTRSENAIVIQSMVAIAREGSRNGVVQVGGTERHGLLQERSLVCSQSRGF